VICIPKNGALQSYPPYKKNFVLEISSDECRIITIGNLDRKTHIRMIKVLEYKEAQGKDKTRYL